VERRRLPKGKAWHGGTWTAEMQPWPAGLIATAAMRDAAALWRRHQQKR
jgi:hypothetical protein